jgi:signal transduction histidine kinase
MARASLIQARADRPAVKTEDGKVVLGVFSPSTARRPEDSLSERSAECMKQASPSSAEHQWQRQQVARQEEERRLLAYELHDSFVQLAVGAKMNLESFMRLRSQDPAKSEAVLQTSLQLLDNAVDEARRVITGLRPPVLDDSGVLAAIGDFLFEAPQQNGPDVEFFHAVSFDRLEPELETAIFRIVQEAVRNAQRHSQSHTIRLELTEERGRVHIDVRDWGVGFDVDQVPENHFGLEGMRERVRLVSGAFRIESVPGQGTHVHVELPMSTKPA